MVTRFILAMGETSFCASICVSFFEPFQPSLSAAPRSENNDAPAYVSRQSRIVVAHQLNCLPLRDTGPAMLVQKVRRNEWKSTARPWEFTFETFFVIDIRHAHKI